MLQKQGNNSNVGQRSTKNIKHANQIHKITLQGHLAENQTKKSRHLPQVMWLSSLLKACVRQALKITEILFPGQRHATDDTLASEIAPGIWQTSELKQLENLIPRRASNSEAERASKNARLPKQKRKAAQRHQKGDIYWGDTGFPTVTDLKNK